MKSLYVMSASVRISEIIVQASSNLVAGYRTGNTGDNHSSFTFIVCSYLADTFASDVLVLLSQVLSCRLKFIWKLNLLQSGWSLLKRFLPRLFSGDFR